MPPRIPPLLSSLIRPRHVRHARPPTSRSLVAAPKPGDGPLMMRRPDRALPAVRSPYRWLRTIPLFLAIVGGSALAIFNYQKSSSSVVESTLYALRTSAEARAVLGDEIYFASKMPWIWGEINQLHGRIDVSYWVKGTRGQALMRFRSLRKSRMGYFDTLEWSLTTEDGRTIQLLKPDSDPFRAMNAGQEESAGLA